MKSKRAGVFIEFAKQVDADPRRIIFEVTDDSSFSVQIIEALSSKKPLGNHYHPTGRTETFTLIKGSGRFVSYPVNKSGKRTGPNEGRLIMAPTVIHIPPYNVHAFFLKKGSILIGNSTREFRKSDFCEAPEKITS